MRLLESSNGVVDSVISLSVEIENDLSETEGYVSTLELHTLLIVSYC
jgi:hypothetical protein